MPNRLDVVADAIDVLGSAVMGLTVKCAQCHDHEFDPIPQQDYYSLAAILKGAYDEHDWLKPNAINFVDQTPEKFSARCLPHVPADELRVWKDRDDELKREIASLKTALKKKAAALEMEQIEERLAELPEVLRSDIRLAFSTPADQRSEIQKYLSEKFESVLLVTDEKLREIDKGYDKEAEETDKQVDALEKKRRPKPMIRALWDRGEPSHTYLLDRGNYLTPGRLVEPAALSVLSNSKLDIKPPWPGAKKTGRRLALAKWLIQSDHPLTSRVMVNTIWKHHFRHGIVKSIGNFGSTGALPTHPELLDWLAREFIENGWSIKYMHRLIMTSSTYRQSSAVLPDHERLDLDNDLVSRFPMKRMEAEVLWDTLLLISGCLDETPFGPADGVNVRPNGLVTAEGTEKGWRRSIFVEHNRKQNMTILECFDLPRPTPNCVERKLSTVAPQALHLLNNETVYQLSQSFAERVIREMGADAAKQIDRSYQLALGRSPMPDEMQLATATLQQLKDEWKEAESDSNLKALTDLCHVLINSAEFIYID